MAKRTIDFGELQNDTKFTVVVNNFEENLERIEDSINLAVTTFQNFDDLTTQEKVKMDNYLAYSINSLYWMYVKLQGLDPNEHGIKNELSRVRQTILRDKQILERKTLRPVLDKAAAGRFIKRGLHIRFENSDEESESANLNQTNDDATMDCSQAKEKS